MNTPVKCSRDDDDDDDDDGDGMMSHLLEEISYYIHGVFPTYSSHVLTNGWNTLKNSQMEISRTAVPPTINSMILHIIVVPCQVINSFHVSRVPTAIHICSKVNGTLETLTIVQEK